MRRSGAALRLTILSLAGTAFAAGCGGGGGNPTLPGTSPSTPPGGAGPNAAVVTFHAVVPPKGQKKDYRGLKPDYIAPTATTLTIQIKYPGSSKIATLTSQKQCDSSGCFFNATTSLPVSPNPYLFTVSASGTTGKALSSAFVNQTLVPGPNSVTLTLDPIVDHAAVSVTGTLSSGGTAIEKLPISAATFDADGNPVPNGLTFASEFPIAVIEVDPLNAFSLVTTSAGSADCNISTPATCSLRSNADSISIAFNPSATAFAPEPSYYPQEAIIDGTGDAGATFTSGNSTAVATPKCLPQPICVYAEPFYPLVLATGSINAATQQEISPLLSIAAGSTIYTDTGTITSAGTTAYTFNRPSGGTNLSSQFPSGLQYVPATGNVYTVDYSGIAAPDGNQYIDTISPNAVLTTTEYTPDKNNLFSFLGSGDDIILGPDGNLWWIDPSTGDLRFANPATPGTAGVCQLNPSSQTLFLSAYQIVSTPAGVSPSRIWFSAFDAVNSVNNYLGYVNVASGSNSCGPGQAGHYAVVDSYAGQIPAVPYGMAVDGNGTLWFNSGNPNAQDYTSIGQGTVNGTGGVTLTKPVKLPGAMGAASSAWDILYDPQDGYLYTAVDGGLIGRFSPSGGVTSAAAYALPLPIAATMFNFSSENSSSSCPTSSTPACFPQFSWDPGSGGPHGRLTFVVTAGFGGASSADNVVQLDLDYSGAAGVTFSAVANNSLPARFHGRFPSRKPHSRRFRRF